MKANIVIGMAFLSVSSLANAEFLGLYTTETVPGLSSKCRVSESRPMRYSSAMAQPFNNWGMMSDKGDSLLRGVEQDVASKGYDALVGYNFTVAYAGDGQALTAMYFVSGVAVKIKCS